MQILFRPFFILFNIQMAFSIIQKIDPNAIDSAYQLAQISPPGSYQIVIWSDLHIRKDCEEKALFRQTNNEKLLFLWNTLLWIKAQLPKCFVHFHSVATDQNGQFMLEKGGTIKNEKTSSGKIASVFANGTGGKSASSNNGIFHFHVIPLNKTMEPIYDEVVAAQKVHSLSKNVPVDSWCHKNGTNRCIFEYFDFEQKSAVFSEILSHLFKDFNSDLFEKKNFFLIGILQDLLEKAKNKQQTDGKFAEAKEKQQTEGNLEEANDGNSIETENATLLDIFWKFLDKTEPEKNPLLNVVKHRLLDGRLISLIKQFCQIDQNLGNTFCARFSSENNKMLQFSHPSLAVSTFRYWLQPTAAAAGGQQSSTAGDQQSSTALGDEMSTWIDQMSEEKRQIVKFWMSILSSNISLHCDKFLASDMHVLRHIGKFLNEGVNSGKLTKETMVFLMRGVQDEFCIICDKFQAFLESCPSEEQLKLLPWLNVVNELKCDPIDKQSIAFDELLMEAASVPSSASTSPKSGGANNLRGQKQRQKTKKTSPSVKKFDFCGTAKADSAFADCHHGICKKCAAEAGQSNRCPKCGRSKSLKCFTAPNCFL